MNRIRYFITTITLGLLMSSCVQRMTLQKSYYTNAKTVGAIYIIPPISVYKNGQQGLLDMAVTKGKKYKEPLEFIDKKLNLEKGVKLSYSNFFENQKKPLKLFDYIYDETILKKFQKPKSSKKKYYKYDVRHFKQKGIDELLLIKVKYGLLITYYGMIEANRYGHCQVDSYIIDLNDNSLIYREQTKVQIPLKGKWNDPPYYKKLESVVSMAIKNALEMERQKLKP